MDNNTPVALPTEVSQAIQMAVGKTISQMKVVYDSEHSQIIQIFFDDGEKLEIGTGLILRGPCYEGDDNTPDDPILSINGIELDLEE